MCGLGKQAHMKDAVNDGRGPSANTFVFGNTFVSGNTFAPQLIAPKLVAAQLVSPSPLQPCV